MKKRKIKHPCIITEGELQQAIWNWDQAVNRGKVNCGKGGRWLSINGFLTGDIIETRWGLRATMPAYRRLQMLISPHHVTLLRVHAVKHNKQLLFKRLQGVSHG